MPLAPITQISSLSGSILENSSGVTLSANTTGGLGHMLIVVVGWDSSLGVGAPEITLDGSTAALVTTAENADTDFHLGLFVFPDPSTSGDIVISFASTVHFFWHGYVGFSGTTAISTATIVATTGTSTQAGVTVTGTEIFSYPFVAMYGTRPAGSNYTTAHSSMTEVLSQQDFSTQGWSVGYSNSLSDQIAWNLNANGRWVSLGFSLDPEVEVVDITPNKSALHFNVRISESNLVPTIVNAHQADVSFNVRISEPNLHGVVPSQSLHVILED